MAELALVAAPIGAIEGAGAIGAAAAVSTISLSTIFTGATLAWSIGSTLFSMFGPGSSATGPRLKDVHVQSAAFGSPVKRFWGTDRMAGQIIWASKIREHVSEQGGKGAGAGSVTIYTYDVDVAISIVGSSKVKGVRRIWAGPKLIYDVSNQASFSTLVASAIQLKGKVGKFFFYDGAETQLPPATIEAAVGAGNCPAYRNQCVIVFKNFRLENFGNQIPQFSFEIFSEGEEDFKQLAVYDPVPDNLNYRADWGFVDDQGEIFGLYYDASRPFDGYADSSHTLFHFAPAGTTTAVKIPDISPVGGAFQVNNQGSPRLRSDEQSYAGRTSNYPPGGHCYVLYFSVATGTETYFDIGTSDFTTLVGYGTLALDILVKHGTDFYCLVNSFPMIPDANKGWLIRTNAAGGILASTHALWDLGGAVDLVRSDNFLWALITSASLIVQLDPDTLDVVATHDISSITGTSSIEAIYAVSDEQIGIFGTGAASYFYYLDPTTDTITTVATAVSPGVAISAQRDFNLQINNGLWYVSYSGYAGGDTSVHIFGSQITVDCIPLWKIVRDICLAAGLEESEIDVSELNDCVHGYTLESQISGRDAILPLQRTYFFDGRESDGLIDFPKRGHDAAMTIPQADMAARPSLADQLPPALASTRAQETELPVRVHVRYKDQDAAYQTGHAYSSRLISESKNVETVDIPVAMTAELAQRAAWVLLATKWLEREPKEIRLSRRYLPLDAADPVSLELDNL